MFEAGLGHDLAGQVVVDFDCAIVGGGGEVVGVGCGAETVDDARVVGEQLTGVLRGGAEAQVKAPDAAVGVLGEPDGGLFGYVFDH